MCHDQVGSLKYATSHPNKAAYGMLLGIASGGLSHAQSYQHVVQHNWYEKAPNFLCTFMQMQPYHNAQTVCTVLVRLPHQTMC